MPCIMALRSTCLIPLSLLTAKNVVLAGVRGVTIHDQKHADLGDLSAQFYLTQDDLGQNRAEACKERLQELNTAVEVVASTVDLTADYIKQFQVIIGRHDLPHTSMCTV